MTLKIAIAFTALLGLSSACTSSGGNQATTPTTGSTTTAGPTSSGPTTSPLYQPQIDPANFTTTIDNPLFPLKPGTRFVYKGTSEGETQRDVIEVTQQTKTIMGVQCVAVSDTLTHGKTLLEKTTDWYAQDREGNVWYFGEDTAEYNEKGEVTTREGSWQAGVDGAQPGIIMPAHPNVPFSYRQEFYQGHAEDMAWVVSTSQSARVPYGSFKNGVLTLEWTPLEPNVFSQKVYASGVGEVAERDVAGGNDRFVLVTVSTG